MNRYILAFFLLVTAIINAKAQIETAIYKIEGFSDLPTNSAMIGKKLPPPEIEGDIYLVKDWVRGSITLNNDKVIEDLDLKVDLYNQHLEIMYKNIHKSVPSKYVKEFKLVFRDGKRRRFVNLGMLDLKNRKLDGFGEVLFDDNERDHCIYRNHYIEVKDPTYIEGVGVGNRNYELLNKTKDFIKIGLEAHVISKNHKKNFEIIEHKKEISSVASKKIKSTDDFISLLTWIQLSKN